MPFTVSHAAAAWAFRRAWPPLPFAALVIGAMSPDFEYWLRLSPSGRVAHSMGGIVLFCLPVSVAIWAVFHRLVRRAVLDALPAPLSAAVPPPRTGTRDAVVAIVLGALSHLVWDGFTHENDWGVDVFPALRREMVPDLGVSLPWFSLLQHVSTAVGLLFVCAWTWRWLRRQPAPLSARDPDERRRFVLLLVLTVGPGLAGAFLNGWRGGSVESMRTAAGLAAVGGMVGISLGLAVVTGAYWRRIRRLGRGSVRAVLASGNPEHP